MMGARGQPGVQRELAHWASRLWRDMLAAAICSWAASASIGGGAGLRHRATCVPTGATPAGQGGAAREARAQVPRAALARRGRRPRRIAATAGAAGPWRRQRRRQGRRAAGEAGRQKGQVPAAARRARQGAAGAAVRFCCGQVVVLCWRVPLRSLGSESFVALRASSLQSLGVGAAAGACTQFEHQHACSFSCSRRSTAPRPAAAAPGCGASGWRSASRCCASTGRTPRASCLRPTDGASHTVSPPCTSAVRYAFAGQERPSAAIRAAAGEPAVKPNGESTQPPRPASPRECCTTCMPRLLFSKLSTT